MTASFHIPRSSLFTVTPSFDAIEAEPPRVLSSRLQQSLSEPQRKTVRVTTGGGGRGSKMMMAGDKNREQQQQQQ
jgi:hypothetical protein